MNKTICNLLLLLLVSSFVIITNTESISSLYAGVLSLYNPILGNIPILGEKGKDLIEKKYFKDENTFIIICKGWPKEELTGKARIESAKEAALMNAQFIAKDLFDESVDVVKRGRIKKYNIYEDYVTIQYIIKYNGLKKHYKENK